MSRRACDLTREEMEEDIMGTDLVVTLEGEVFGLIHGLDEHPGARRLFAGAVTVAEYAHYLEQTYHYVRWTRPLLARAGERLAEAGGQDALAELLLGKAAEETGHEQWALSDLGALGRDAEAVRRSRPCAAVEAYVAWNRFTAEAGSPLAFLGTAYVLESLSALRAGEAVMNLLARGAIPRIEEAVLFLRGHAGADGPHIAHLASVLREVADPKARGAIALSARVTRELYAGIFDRGAHAGRVTDATPRSSSSEPGHARGMYH